jgi:divalent anion:Na+ symporter, DASS family
VQSLSRRAWAIAGRLHQYMRDGTLEASLRRRLTLLAVFLLAVIIWFIPPPPGVQPRAWHLLAIFVATIVGIILKPLPMGAIAMIGVAATALSGTLTINQALSGFGNSTIWLIVVAFFISRGFIKTGLGSRIAYLFMAALGKRTLGLSYGLIATDLVLAPAVPSNTARAGGIVFPLVRASAKHLAVSLTMELLTKLARFSSRQPFRVMS